MTSIHLTALITLGSVIVAAPLPEKKSWVGKMILIKKPGIKVGPIDKDATTVLTGIDYEVLAARDQWIKVREHGVEGWFDRSEAVLLDEAFEYFTGQIKQNEKDSFAYVCRAQAQVLKREFTKGVADFSKAIRLQPDLPQAYCHCGIAYQRLGKLAEAIQSYNRAIELRPDFPEAYCNRGNAYHQSGQMDVALTDYGQAIALQPKYAEAYRNRGIAFVQLGQHEQALSDFSKALESKPDAPDIYFNRAKVYFQLRQFDNARKDVMRGQKLGGKPDPAFLDALNKAAGKAK